MIDREQMRQLCRWNRELGSENARLIERNMELQQDVRELEVANAKLREEIAALREENANLLVERDAGDVVLGAAMDELFSREKS